MDLPSQNDYVDTYFTLFELFQQGRDQQAGRGRPFTYEDRALIVFFSLMLIKRITASRHSSVGWLAIRKKSFG